MTDETMGDVVVTQADRVSAAKHTTRGHGKLGRYTFSAAYMIQNGHWDDDPLVQAFARHRLASRPAPEQIADNANCSEASGDVVEVFAKAREELGDPDERKYPSDRLAAKAALEMLTHLEKRILPRTPAPQADALHPVLVEIMAEVEKATRKFPTWPTRVIDAGNVVSEEAGELAKACLQVTYEPHKETLEGVRMEAVQTAAMAFRFLCSIDRYDCTPAEQHEQDPLSTLTESQTDAVSSGRVEK